MLAEATHEAALDQIAHFRQARSLRAFFRVRQAWRVARKRNQLGYGGHAGDLEVRVLCSMRSMNPTFKMCKRSTVYTFKAAS
jgi:hypothetical protein